MSVAEPITAPIAHTMQLPESERLARLRLGCSLNVGPRTYSYLLRRFGNAEQALEAMPSMAAAGGKRDYVPCPISDAEAEVAAGQNCGATMVLLGEPEYPALLVAIDHPPRCYG